MEEQLLSKKERKALRREERGQKSKKTKFIAWGIGIVVVGGIGALFLLPSRPESPRPGQAFPIQGQTHIAVGASHIAYNSNPPTSGPHYAQPAGWGVYHSELPDEQLIHNLEHGGIWISYKGIDATTTTALEKIANSQAKIVMEPRANDDAPIVLASWGRLQKFQTYDEQAILAFIEANRNQSPEPLAQ